MPDLVCVGPWGGPEGEGIPWDYKPDGSIREIVIQHGTVIDSIVFKSRRTDGAVITSNKFGGGGGKSFTVTIQPGEIITGIDVMLGDFQGHSVVHNLCIRTNKTTHGPFGTESGTRTSIPVVDGEVIGFFGRASQYLNAIGFQAVVRPKSSNPIQDNKGNKAMSIGPWGSSEGNPWTYLPPGIITKIVITYGGCIDSLIFECKGGNGVILHSKQFGGTSTAKYGGPGGHTTKEVVIDSGEYITGIDMLAGEYDGHKVINQLTIRTNRKLSGPFGTATTGSKFSIPIKDGRIVGFFGRSNLYLNAIGIFVAKSSSQEDKDDKTDDNTDDETDDKTDEKDDEKDDKTDEKDDNTDDKTDDNTDDKVVPCAINKISLNINISVKLNSSK